jgi:hypothetical protein
VRLVVAGECGKACGVGRLAGVPVRTAPVEGLPALQAQAGSPPQRAGVRVGDPGEDLVKTRLYRNPGARLSGSSEGRPAATAVVEAGLHSHPPDGYRERRVFRPAVPQRLYQSPEVPLSGNPGSHDPVVELAG